jgi:hypothetical protein
LIDEKLCARVSFDIFKRSAGPPGPNFGEFALKLDRRSRLSPELDRLRAYALQFTCAIERGNPLSKIVVSHWASWERMIINA